MAWLGIIVLGLTVEMAMIVMLGRAATDRHLSVPLVAPVAASTRRGTAAPLGVHPRKPSSAERIDPVRSGRAG
jgi:hypothetical protein